ncbi:DUF4268 domain-containing protein [Flavivirga aquimarina]|uniref:DUF4268 domain-containing protein n=1 Tax=Flavivirga aquimarina TaxID=2027862 RepID=A0ABT8WCN7_9FLAO|nr:DUF4268 domain-containing protein [Flavivirga aquimarina]MDO5970808.1 DUF4268 domain-containing protein [Flavivirga aquimarina]
MFLINKNNNRIEKISEKTFTELGFKERENLQEWLADNPTALGEELLIIQKEFSGFSDTNERLDLLALDKQGNLVIIENKLDDSGKNVTWQCLKYASYCSSLKKSQIIKIYQEFLNKSDSALKAEESISDFLDGLEIEEITLNSGLTQRLMLVSGSFRKEVTSTVIWLLNYGIRLQCFQATPYALEEQLFLNVEQIIPMKEAEEFSISMAEKTQEDIASQKEIKNRHIVRKKFWNQVINRMNSKSDLYQNISPSRYNWIGAGSGVRGVGYNFTASKNYGRAELYIDRGDKTENEFVFDSLLSKKETIESKFGEKLEWERLNNKRACRIKYEDTNFNIFEPDTWELTIEKITTGMVNLEKAIKPHLNEINRKVKAL